MRFEPEGMNPQTDINPQTNDGIWVKYLPEVEPLDLGGGVEGILERIKAFMDREETTTSATGTSDLAVGRRYFVEGWNHFYSWVKTWNLKSLRKNLKHLH